MVHGSPPAAVAGCSYGIFAWGAWSATPDSAWGATPDLSATTPELSCSDAGLVCNHTRSLVKRRRTCLQRHPKSRATTPDLSAAAVPLLEPSPRNPADQARLTLSIAPLSSSRPGCPAPGTDGRSPCGSEAGLIPRIAGTGYDFTEFGGNFPWLDSVFRGRSFPGLRTASTQPFHESIPLPVPSSAYPSRSG